MASKTSAREERKKKMVRVVAIVACAALLLTALLPYIASALSGWTGVPSLQGEKKRRFPNGKRRFFAHSTLLRKSFVRGCCGLPSTSSGVPSSRM